MENNIFEKLKKISNISILEKCLVDLILWKREIIKLEVDLDYYTDENILKILQKFNLEKTIIYARYISSDDKFILFAKNKGKLNKFLHYDFSDDITKRVVYMWKKLWYPKCCIQKYLSYLKYDNDSGNIDNIIPYNEDSIFFKYNNEIIEHYPCRDDCEETIKNFKRNFKYIVKKYNL